MGSGEGDDTVYQMYAARIAEHPGDPYGGEIVDYWFPPKAGMDVLVPVFLPYLWSRAILVHGDNTFLAKLWLAPFPLFAAASPMTPSKKPCKFGRNHTCTIVHVNFIKL